MTGFGKKEISLPNKNITIEIKTLNSKNLDAVVKLPLIYREKELEIRQILAKSLVRGKVEFNMYYELSEEATPAYINEELFRNYFHSLKKLADETGLPVGEGMMQSILKLPETIRYEKQELDEEEWRSILAGISQTLDEVSKFRKQEGTSMHSDLESWVDGIEEQLSNIEPYEDERIKRIKERIEKNLHEIATEESLDRNRLEQEMIFYIEKLDISEEKTRLSNHLNYFRETMQQPQSSGKKLSFISQEMGREINTIGSKANDSDIQHLVIKMKDNLEKIKEQLANIL